MSIKMTDQISLKGHTSRQVALSSEALVPLQAFYTEDKHQPVCWLLTHIIREEGFRMLQNTKSLSTSFLPGACSTVISKPNKFVFLLKCLLSSEAKILYEVSILKQAE